MYLALFNWNNFSKIKEDDFTYDLGFSSISTSYHAKHNITQQHGPS